MYRGYLSRFQRRVDSTGQNYREQSLSLKLNQVELCLHPLEWKLLIIPMTSVGQTQENIALLVGDNKPSLGGGAKMVEE